MFFRKGALLVWVCLLSRCGLAVSPAPPVIPAGIFNVTNYGAIGNGVFTNSAALQATVNAIGAAGGGTLEIPAGTFLCGPFTLTNNLRFQLDAGALLRLLPYGSYPGGTSPPDFIYIDKSHDIEFSGPGAIDGQGQAWWDANLDISEKPYLIHFDNSFQRVWFHGLTMTNTPMKHIVIDGIGGDVLIEGMYINESGDSPNTDGINLQGTNCLVRNCTINAGDDNIAMGRSSGQGSDILITNITCGVGHGISIGSITKAGESNITVVNCSFTGTEFGLRLKADNDRGGLVQNINCHDITMTNVGMAIVIYSYYNELGSPSTISKVTPSKVSSSSSYAPMPLTNTDPIWRNITFSNITGSASTSGAAIWGRPEMLVSNVTLANINITAPQVFNVYNARGVTIADSQFDFSSGSTFSLFNAQVTITNSSLAAAAPFTLDGLSAGTTNNELLLFNCPASLSNTNLLGTLPRLTLGGGTLAIANNLALMATSTVNFVLGPAATVALTGNLKLGGTNNITAGQGFGPGTYTLFTYSGSLSGSLPVIGSKPTGYNYNFDTNTAGVVKLVVASNAPRFANYRFAGGNGGRFIASGTGGPTNGNYYLLISTNVALPLNQWTLTATNQFDGNGNFSFTNGAGPALPQLFYRLELP